MDNIEKLRQENLLLQEKFDKAFQYLQETKAELDRLKTLNAERAEKSAELLGNVIDLLGDGVLEVNKYGTIIYYSKQLNSIFPSGTKLEINKSIFSFLTKRDKRKILQYIPALKKGEVIKESISFVSNGGIHHVIASIKPKVLVVDGMNKLVGAVISLTNISQLKETEKKLIKAKEKALLATKVKSEFLSRMTHEIRTPIHAITNFTQVLIDSEPNPSQLEYLEFIRFSSENLLSIVNDVLDFSKMEAGKMVFENTSFDIEKLLHTVYNIFRQRSEHKNLFFELKISNSFPKFVSGDSAKLTQILSNLLTNAVKFTSKGGVVLSGSVVSETDKQLVLKFSVKDTGIGIAKSKLKTVFKEFEQAEVYTNREFGGTGLGLTISKYFVEHQKGTISVESKLGAGSSFVFELPFEKPGINDIPLETTTKEKESRSLYGACVLIAEDNHLNQVVAKKMIAKWEGKADLAENGLVACELASKNHYDLILMDIEMPVMNGYEATKEIRSFNKDVPIVALTASLLVDVRENSVGSGMDSFVSKPFTEDELWEVISPYVQKLV